MTYNEPSELCENARPAPAAAGDFVYGDSHVTEASNVIHATFGRKTTDGGKARIQARRARNHAEPIFDWRDEDLTMDHADPCNMPSDSAYPNNLA